MAGYSAGTGVCARGGRAAKRCGSVETVRHLSAPDDTVLFGAVCHRLCHCLRFWRGVLPSVRARRYGSVDVFYPRFTPAVCRIAPNRTACDMFRSYSAVGRDRHSCVLAALVRLSTLAGSLRVCSFICGDPDGVTGDTRNGERGTGERGWRRSVSALLRNHIGFAMFSAGSTLGLRAPDCAKESSTLWTLFTLRRGYVSADSRPYRKRQRPNHRTHACKTQVHGKT